MPSRSRSSCSALLQVRLPTKQLATTTNNYIDGKEESQQWETEYLQDDSVRHSMEPRMFTPADPLQLKQLIETQAVALRLQAGSDEAGYLSQIFPLPKTPTIVIMKHGELKEYIAAGTLKDDFFRRMHTSLGSAPRSPPQAIPASQPAPQTPSTPIPGLSSSPEAGTSSDSVKKVLAERAARSQQAKEEAERKAKEAQAKAEAEASASPKPNPQADEYKVKRQQKSEERQRILQRIEDDKQARRMAAEERERQRSQTGESTPTNGTRRPSTTKISETTSIQVRLLDGTTIRSRFKTSASVTDIRKWVDGERNDGELPYKFKQILTPLPNKNIDEAEESKSLLEIGLAPSSTLLLIPVTRYAAAYTNDQGGIFSRLLALIFSFLTGILSIFGLGGQSSPAGPQQTELQPAASSTAAERTREAAKQRQKDYQLYNGNSVSQLVHPDL